MATDNSYEQDWSGSSFTGHCDEVMAPKQSPRLVELKIANYWLAPKVLGESTEQRFPPATQQQSANAVRIRG